MVNTVSFVSRYRDRDIYLHIFIILFVWGELLVLGVELKALSLLGRCIFDVLKYVYIVEW
jgi:hypothetical protein